ncbi:uncharacterized protein LOC113496110 [Trichoplusia ni]|uniref:Uncharacterized protein LOC113496110 n=1 Tax=Trichoplusia ni TaxID=7111 RepID=A0A7E5VRX6_TRINI|nr:uncharacterized protein LOC113496110 [Trichoplusia ni]
MDALSIEEKSGLKAALHPFLVECEEKFGMSEEQFEEEKNKGVDANIDPCFMSCFLKNAEFFDSKGMLDVEKTTEFMKANIQSEDALQIFDQITEECSKVNDEEVSDGDEGCDRAQLLFKCIVEVKKKASVFETRQTS